MLDGSWDAYIDAHGGSTLAGGLGSTLDAGRWTLHAGHVRHAGELELLSKTDLQYNKYSSPLIWDRLPRSQVMWARERSYLDIPNMEVD